MRPTFLKVGVPHNNVRPPTTVRPPTSSGNAPSLDVQGWIESENPSAVEIETGVSGDIIVIVGFGYNDAGSFSTPSGYTEVGLGTDSDDEIAVYAKVADGTETATVSITSPSGDEVFFTNRIHANGATLTLNTEWSFTTGQNPGALTLADDTDFFVITMFLKQHSGTDPVWTTPDGYTQAEDWNSGIRYARLAQKNVTGTGTEDPTTWDVTFTGGASAGTSAAVASFGVSSAGASVATADHTHVEADVTDLAHTDATAIHDNVASEISAITAKGAPTSSDFLLIEDAADSNNKKSITIGDLPGGASDHGALTGLADDDHTQYVLADGTRAATYLEVSGLTGATGSSPRFVGGTTTGAPVSGTFALGDFIVTEDGSIYICTVAGSPGTWSAVSGGSSDHGALTGLADDDHTQYLLADGTRQATYLEVSGLTGATGSSPRFVGGTTTGSPASGTFALGDYVVTEDGNVYICTTAGSPGTWTAVGAGAATDADAIHDNVAGEISAITAKATPTTSDFLLIEDAAASNAKKRITIGDLPSSGGSEYIFHHAVVPASPDAFDEEFDTDPTAGWTWVNQSTASVQVANDQLVLYDSRNANNVSMIGVAPPSGDWTIETLMYPWFDTDGTSRHGGFLAVRYGTTVNTLGHWLLNNPRTLTFASSGTGAATSQSTSYGQAMHGPCYYRAVWDDTAGTLDWELSFTGESNTWFQIHTFSPGSTPDLIGMAGQWNTGRAIGYTFEYLRRTA